MRQRHRPPVVRVLAAGATAPSIARDSRGSAGRTAISESSRSKSSWSIRRPMTPILPTRPITPAPPARRAGAAVDRDRAWRGRARTRSGVVEDRGDVPSRSRSASRFVASPPDGLGDVESQIDHLFERPSPRVVLLEAPRSVPTEPDRMMADLVQEDRTTHRPSGVGRLDQPGHRAVAVVHLPAHPLVLDRHRTTRTRAAASCRRRGGRTAILHRRGRGRLRLRRGGGGAGVDGESPAPRGPAVSSGAKEIPESPGNAVAGRAIDGRSRVTPSIPISGPRTVPAGQGPAAGEGRPGRPDHRRAWTSSSRTRPRPQATTPSSSTRSSDPGHPFGRRPRRGGSEVGPGLRPRRARTEIASRPGREPMDHRPHRVSVGHGEVDRRILR